MTKFTSKPFFKTFSVYRVPKQWPPFRINLIYFSNPYLTYYLRNLSSCCTSVLQIQRIFKMAETADKVEGKRFINVVNRKRKHIGEFQVKKAKEKRSAHSKGERKGKNAKSTLPQLPKTVTEMSHNWKILQGILQKERKVKEQKGKMKIQTKKKFNQRFKVNGTCTLWKTSVSSSDLWFDDVDPEDLQQVTGSTKPKTSNQDSNETLVTGSIEGVTKKIALDCEMVGVGFDGKQHMLARVSIVNSHGHTIYDSFVAPQEKVVDYRTPVSGVKSADLKNAPDFKTVQLEVSKLLKGRILVGHALRNDLSVLFLDHPRRDIRDTATYKPFQDIVKSKKPALRNLAQQLLNITIHQGEHSSVQDAQVTMKLYMMHKNQWERQLKEAKFKHPKTKQSKRQLATKQVR